MSGSESGLWYASARDDSPPQPTKPVDLPPFTVGFGHPFNKGLETGDVVQVTGLTLDNTTSIQCGGGVEPPHPANASRPNDRTTQVKAT
eukprot:CAMPEP_0175993902 /NCGR_PEP_ID=MMETSP0108-20121206/54245_1 /TAXON_ID=195067 ORGANISM="Goniomonas pacifica, Strain CCMP1869" /NCGR_SAMPLE_ID=MMETSP0108 /ASSEMBLY_ACC=CAM_ASM_000204 /LENGTH=88 /DNA_ID=CAMNT_0017325787 /DNA_START=1 /DNA_END=265 /DNA_ORIENTATION=-